MTQETSAPKQSVSKGFLAFLEIFIRGTTRVPFALLALGISAISEIFVRKPKHKHKRRPF